MDARLRAYAGAMEKALSEMWSTHCHANERWLHKARLVFQTQAPEVSLQPVLPCQSCSRSQLHLSQRLVIVADLRGSDPTLLTFNSLTIDFDCYTMAKLYEVKTSFGKGQGVFATLHIQPGDIIMRDEARMRIPDYVNGVSARQIQEALATLSPTHRVEFLQLSEGTKESTFNFVNIYRANSFGSGASGTDAIVCLKVSRVNHACIPNSELDMQNESDCKLFATREIKKGEEVLVNYCGSGTKARRQELLQNHYGFLCQCVTCSLTGEALELSDTRRNLYNALLQLINGATRENDMLIKPWKAPTDRERVPYNFLAAGLLEAEGISGTTIAVCYENAAESLLAQIRELKHIIVLPAIKLLIEFFELSIRWRATTRHADAERLRLSKGYWAALQATDPHLQKGRKAVSLSRVYTHRCLC